jgi:hypothetical protein
MRGLSVVASTVFALHYVVVENASREVKTEASPAPILDALSLVPFEFFRLQMTIRF